MRKTLVIDEESYVFVDPQGMPGRRFYYSSGLLNASYGARSKPTSKFAKKFMVLLALDADGNVSEPYICTSEVYLRECIKKRLIPFIMEHPKREDVFLAESGYLTLGQGSHRIPGELQP